MPAKRIIYRPVESSQRTFVSILGMGISDAFRSRGVNAILIQGPEVA
jgi:hypothetical protein